MKDLNILTLQRDYSVDQLIKQRSITTEAIEIQGDVIAISEMSLRNAKRMRSERLEVMYAIALEASKSTLELLKMHLKKQTEDIKTRVVLALSFKSLAK